MTNAGMAGPVDQVLLDALASQRIGDRDITTVRRIARHWVDGVKTLLGLVGTIGLLGAPLAGDGLGRPARAVVGGLLAGSLASAVAALLLAMSAAYGGTRTTALPPGAPERRELRAQDAQRALSHLCWGRRLAVASLLCLAVAVGVAWISPESTSSAHVRATTIGGVVHCGELAPAVDDHVRLVDDGPPIDIPFNDIRSLIRATTC